MRRTALKWAEEHQPQTAFDYPPGQIVIARPRDECGIFVFDSASAVKHENYWIVFPEHHEAQVFHEDEYDVSTYRMVR